MLLIYILIINLNCVFQNTKYMIQGYNKINICPICGSKVGNKHFSRHVKSHVTEHICELCNSKYSRKDSLKRHIRSFHDRVLFTCLNCSKSFQFEEGLRNHSQRRRCKQGIYNSIFLVNISVSVISNVLILRDIKKLSQRFWSLSLMTNQTALMLWCQVVLL